MRNILHQNRYFLIPYLLYLIIGGIFLLIFPKGTLELALNHKNHYTLDEFFKYFTLLGEGIFCMAVIIGLLFYRFYAAFITTASIIAASSVTQFLKRLVFADVVRPKLFFSEEVTLYWVKGVVIHQHHSFPSGHSTAGFAIFFSLALLTYYKPLGILFFLAALLVSISRIYLLQHFFIDTYFGSLIGVSMTLMIFYYFDQKTQLKSHKFLNKKLL